MNNRLSLKNFRVFDEKGVEFEIAPITILTGCNSSGKSSVIKSLMLVQEMFKSMKNDYVNGQSFQLSKYELLFNKGKHNLGTYKKTVNRQSKSNEISFSWSKYSPILNGNIDIEIVFCENENNILQNAKISSLELSYDGNIFYKNSENKVNSFSGNFDVFRQNFSDYLGVLKYYQNIGKQLEEIANNDLDDIIGLTEEGLYESNPQINKDWIDHIISIKKNSINRDSIENLFDDNFTSIKFEKTLFPMPIFDWVRDTKKEDITQQLWSLVEQYNLEPKIYTNLFAVIDDFKTSSFDFLIDYFTYYETIYLNKKRKGNGINMSYSGKNDSFIHAFIDKFSSDNVVFPFLTNNADNVNKGMADFNFDKFLDILKDEELKFDAIQHSLMIFSLAVDVEFAKIIQFDRYNNYCYYYTHPLYDNYIKYIGAIIQDALMNLPSFIENIDFVDSVRANIQRIYSFKNQGTEINQLLVDYVSKQNQETKNGNNNGLDKFKKEYQLGTFMARWIKEFEIADDVLFESTQEGLGILIYLQKGGDRVLLADEGYGITQFLSILLKIELNIIQNQYSYKNPLLSSPPVPIFRFRESTLAIEEPETNLHPKFQSKLADLFADAYKNYNIHFIVETHSEYLIRKLQTLVAKKEIAPNDVSLQYIYNADPEKRAPGKPHVEKINIKEDGRLDKPFGSGFFDEADNLAMDLLTIKSMN